MGRIPVKEAAVADLNLTPMIDVVFQLVIFLMMANDLSRRDLEDLALPPAPHSVQDRQEAGRLTVNLLPGPVEEPPILRLGGAPVDLPGLEAALRVRGAGSILLRADRTCPWRHVQLVMQACAGKGIEIRRIEFAAGKDGGGRP